MLIPKHWSSATGEANDPDGKHFALKIWGWSQNSATEAAALARRRLTEASSRIARGMLDKEAYFYAKTPLREQIVKVVGDSAVVTRNRYGALVLNAPRVPFIDVDKPGSVTDPRQAESGGLFGLFGKKKQAAEADPFAPLLERVRSACGRFPGTSFRIYRTAAGLRLMATDVLMDPKSSETESLLQEFGADPYFVKLCKLQASFRARLTPKPWRAGVDAPPVSYPFDSPAAQRAHDSWLREYESAIESKATCAFVEAVGPGQTLPEAQDVVAEHDRACKIGEKLPLA